MAEIEGKIAELRVERDKVAASVRPDVLKRYGNIRMRRGLAVVSVRNGTCQGCNMNIPPQLYNVLQRGQTVETCPSCHRIIYWEEIMKDDPAAAASLDHAEQRLSRRQSGPSKFGAPARASIRPVIGGWAVETGKSTARIRQRPTWSRIILPRWSRTSYSAMTRSPSSLTLPCRPKVRARVPSGRRAAVRARSQLRR